MCAKEKGKYSDIIQAASQLFMEKGFHKATIEEIADRAGIGKGTIYEYFKNKNHLYISVIEENINIYILELEKTLEKREAFIEKIYCFIEFNEEVVRRHMKYGNFLFQNNGFYFEKKNKEQVCEVFKHCNKEIINIVVGIFSLGKEQERIDPIDIEFCAEMFNAMAMRFCIRMAQENISLKEVAVERNKLVNMLLNGIGKR